MISQTLLVPLIPSRAIIDATGGGIFLPGFGSGCGASRYGTIAARSHVMYSSSASCIAIASIVHQYLYQHEQSLKQQLTLDLIVRFEKALNKVVYRLPLICVWLVRLACTLSWI